MQRDPLGYVDGMGLYEYLHSGPTGAIDPLGLHDPGWTRGIGGPGAHWYDPPPSEDPPSHRGGAGLFLAMTGGVENDWEQSPWVGRVTRGAEVVGIGSAGTAAAIAAWPLVVTWALTCPDQVTQLGNFVSRTLMPQGGPNLPAVVPVNRAAGNAFRDQIANVLRRSGLHVVTEKSYRTPFGKRFIDIEVSKILADGTLEVLGGIETKFGNARYGVVQRCKDAYLKYVEGYIVNVVRGK